ARTRAPDLHAIGTLALRIDDLELGEEGLLPQVPQVEVLFPAELPAQLDLPVFQRHAFGLVQTRQLGRLALFLLPSFTIRPALFVLPRFPILRTCEGRRGLFLLPLHRIDSLNNLRLGPRRIVNWDLFYGVEATDVREFGKVFRLRSRKQPCLRVGEE